MLDFSLGELMMIGAIALVVLGPERLPRVARAFGEWLGKAQRYVTQVRSDIQREIELADLKRLQEEAQQATASIGSSVREVAASLEQAAQSAPAEAASEGGSPANSAPVWSSGGWSSHRFRTRSRPGPSIDELTEAVEQLRSRMSTPRAGRFNKNRYAPRARVNRPRIFR
jgi:sec-independent protein translocase protein TatB